MIGERPDRLQWLFEEARRLERSEREALLSEACADDPRLRSEVETLLAHHDHPVGFIDTPQSFPTPSRFRGQIDQEIEAAAGLVGQTIGRYRIIDRIATGGMGTVYRATQDHPRRTVALKMLRPGLASDRMLRRFEFESDVLALLEHPGIARIYDAGTVDMPDGRRPYFAMEFINGRTLLDYSNHRRLDHVERLELLAAICDAVHHAHQKGVIHRDLKPANILVDEGRPRVLDFGVARAGDLDVQVTTLQTDFGQLVGTVPYMSPEQAAGRVDDIDTRSDVYSIGVLGFELLTGRLPYDLSQKLVHEAVRVIREDEPTRLSLIDRTLRGDVETIIAKALEKESGRRYQSACDLAGDIRRYLTDEPIIARPASRSYQLHKFVRRNCVLVGATAALIAVLLVGVAGTTAGLVRSEIQRHRADRERAASMMVADALAEMFASVSPDTPGSLLVKEAIDDAAGRIVGKLDDFPEAEARVRHAIGEVYLSRTMFDGARPHLERAMALRRELLAQADVDAIRTATLFVTLQMAQGRVEEADRLRNTTLAALRRFRPVDAEARVAFELSYADAHRRYGDQELAAALAVSIRQQALATLGGDHRVTVHAGRLLADVYLSDSRFDEAEALLLEGLDWHRRVDGDDDARTTLIVGRLGSVYENRAEFDKAEALYRSALAAKERVFGADHSSSSGELINLARVLTKQGRYEEAEPMLSRAVELSRDHFGESYIGTTGAMHNLAALHYRLGDRELAEQEFVRVYEVRRKALGPGDMYTLHTLNYLGIVRQDLGRFDEAEVALRESLEQRRAAFGDDEPKTLLAVNNLGDLYRRMERFDEAEPMLEAALHGRLAVAVPDRNDLGYSYAALGRLRLDQQRPEEAEPYLRDAVAMAGQLSETAERRADLGHCLFQLERDEEAAQVLQVALRELRDAFEDDDYRVSAVVELLEQLQEASANVASVSSSQPRTPDTDRSSGP